MLTVHTLVFKQFFLGGKGAILRLFAPDRVTHCTDGVKSTVPHQFSFPTRIYNVHISTLVTTRLRAK